MGEFIDLLLKSRIITGRLSLQWACEEVPPDNLAEFRALPLGEPGVMGLLSVLVPTISRGTMMHDSPELYASESRDSHEFLQELHRLASENGVIIDINRVDVPLTYTEMAVAGGVAKVVNGMVTLTERGERIAQEVQNEIDAHRASPQ